MSGANSARRCCCLRAYGFTLLELVVAVTVIGVLAAIVLPNYIKIKEKAKEAEVKASLHNIQLNVERFAVDHNGDYPAYLIGGDNTALIIDYGNDRDFTYQRSEADYEHCSDPLLRGGYVDCYPFNPFVRNPVAVQQVQGGAGDPLRSALPDGRELGTRFGAQGKLMGQCLCESRYLEWKYCDPATGEIEFLPTWCNIQYEFFDVWAGGQRQRLHLPGSFLYKSMGEILGQPDEGGNQELVEVDGQKAIMPHNNRDQAVYPVNLNSYILSAWGGFRTHGMDLLGEEPLVVFSFPGTIRRRTETSDFILDPVTGRYRIARPTVDHYELLAIPPWTRGVNRSHVGPLWGSPYGASTRSVEQLSIGNPNGYKDALIIVLTNGDERY